MKWYNYFIYGILVALIIYLIFMRPSAHIVEKEIIKYDTVYTYIDRHIIDTVPKLVYVEKLRVDTLKVYLPDSTSIDVPIPIEQRQYANNVDTIGTYKAWVSGYNPQLDSISFDLKYPVTTIYIDRTQIKKKHFNHGIQVGVGYGVFNKRPDLYVGYGFQYSF